MPSRLLNGRTHLDEATLAHCPDQQTIPFLKLHLAPRVNNKIFRPQKAAYMFQNIPSIPQSQKESLISDFVERSIKSKPLDVKPEVYGPYSSNTTRPNVTRDIGNQVTEAISSPDAETNEPRTPDSSVTGLLTPTDMYQEPDNSQDDAPNEADDASDADTDDEGREVAVRHPSRSEPTQPGLIIGDGVSPNRRGISPNRRGISPNRRGISPNRRARINPLQ